jgi:hypothetical protein
MCDWKTKQARASREPVVQSQIENRKSKISALPLHLHPALGAGSIRVGGLHARAHRAIIFGAHLGRAFLRAAIGAVFLVVVTSHDHGEHQTGDKNLVHRNLDGRAAPLRLVAKTMNGQHAAKTSQMVAQCGFARGFRYLPAGWEAAIFPASAWIAFKIASARSGRTTSVAGAHFIPSAARCSVSSRTSTMHLAVG